MPIEIVYCIVVICSVAFLLLSIASYRNELTYKVGMRYIKDIDFPKSHSILPSYNAMLFHPKYWTLWTMAHWEAWVERKKSWIEAGF